MHLPAWSGSEQDTLVEYEHPHSHQCNHSHEDSSAPLLEEPLDPGSQSLADALRVSFRVLKFIMVVVVVFFLFSNVFIVDQTQKGVVARFGEHYGPVRDPGLHFALPYPIDEIIKVTTSPKTMKVDSFWLVLRDKEKARDLSSLSSRGKSLDPAKEGALLTGDKAIMHVLLHVQYRINKAKEFVQNVGNDGDEGPLLQAVLKNAAVAEAARITADVIWRDAGYLADLVKGHAQKTLDAMQTGLLLENVSGEKSYFPLQVKNAFLSVSDAENKKIQLINEANGERVKILNAVAGEAWKALNDEIEKFDHVPDGAERVAVMAKIEDILMSDATGEAGSIIRLAERDRDAIIAGAQGEVSQFEQLLAEYRRNPELFVKRFRQSMLGELYTQPGVTKYILPEGQKQIGLWINQDPEAIREAQREHMKRLAE